LSFFSMGAPALFLLPLPCICRQIGKPMLIKSVTPTCKLIGTQYLYRDDAHDACASFYGDESGTAAKAAGVSLTSPRTESSR
jgi:hypothetical protein